MGINHCFQPDSLTIENLQYAGNLVKGFDMDDFEAIPESTIRDGVSILSELDLMIDQARGVLKKVRP
jgi:hypothetical protein